MRINKIGKSCGEVYHYTGLSSTLSIITKTPQSNFNKQMKTFKFLGFTLLVILMSVSFTACGSDDDDNGGGSSNSIVGKWKIASCDDDWWKNDKGSKYLLAEYLKIDSFGEITALNADGTANSRLFDNKTFYKTETIDGKNYLLIDLNCRGTVEKYSNNDSLCGEYTISGGTLTYRYSWDSSKTEYTLILKKVN